MQASTHACAVGPESDAMRLDRFLTEAVPGSSRNRLKALIEQGAVTLERADGGSEPLTSPARKMRAGERVVVAVPPDAPAEPEAQDIPLSVVYEDDDLLVVEKPSGLVVHPAPGNPDRTLVNAVLWHVGRSGGTLSVGGSERPGIVHRLDKDTSGLMVVAKTDLAHRDLVEQFQERSVERSYHALVWGAVDRECGEIDAPIGRDPRNRKRMAVVSRGGKPAVTRYAVIRRFATGVTLVECRLATGRTHQIRVHMAHLGHPVVGDPLYGGRGRRQAAVEKTAQNGQLLHARTLGFRHPRSGKSLWFESDKFNKIKEISVFLED